MKKPDDWKRKFGTMTLVTHAFVPVRQDRLRTIDHGGDREPAEYKFWLGAEKCLIPDASLPEHSQRNLKARSENPARSESPRE